MSNTRDPLAKVVQSESEMQDSQSTRRIKRLEAQLRGVQNKLLADPAAASDALVNVDRRLWVESDRVVQQEVANSVLDELGHWRRQAYQWELSDTAVETVGVLADLKERTAAGWKSAVEEFLNAPNADGCFQHLQQTTTIHLELLEVSSDADTHNDGLPFFQQLRDAETLLKRAFLDEVSRSPPTRAQRIKWARDLADRAEMILTAIDQVTPEQASAQLGVVLDDIDWHLQHVEVARGTARQRLKRKFTRLRAERQERELQNRLESRFGQRPVAFMERVVLFLICLVIGLMLFEVAWSRPLGGLTIGDAETQVGERDVFDLIGHGYNNAAIVDALQCSTAEVTEARTGIRETLSLANDTALDSYAIRFHRTVFWINIIDAAACFIFLAEFFTKLKMVEGRWLWFRRHVLIDFIPSLPIGLLATGMTFAAGPDALRAGRLARFMRLPRLARYVRLLRPLIRLLRGFGLLARGLDRLARRYGHILNHNIILYPTRQELERAEALLFSDRALLNRLRREVRDTWVEVGNTAEPASREGIAAKRLTVLREVIATMNVSGAQWPDARHTSLREIPAQTLIEKFETVTPQEVEVSLGDDLVGHLAQNIRTFARPPIRWLPIVSRCIPELTPEMTDAEVVSVTATRIASVIRRYHDAYFWVADLYGTVTPSQFVDRVGQMLVKGSSRPAYRLVMFGGFYVLVQLLLQMEIFSGLLPVRHFLERYVGITVAVVGSVCILILLLGNWLKNIAREATELYERSAEARFLSLTEIFRSRQLQRDAEILYERILRPEWEMLHGDDQPDTGKPDSLALDSGAPDSRPPDSHDLSPMRDGAANEQTLRDPTVQELRNPGAETLRAPSAEELREPSPHESPRSISTSSSSPTPSPSAEPTASSAPRSDGDIRTQHLDSFFERVLESIIEAEVGTGKESILPGMDDVTLLYRDWLNGSMFTDSDIRTTSQLLGNPALLQFQKLSGRIDKKQIKQFAKLDLTRQKSLLNGPYIWFNFVSKSISHSVACLLVDYNRNAIPLAELPLVSADERQHYQAWLAAEGPSSESERVIKEGTELDQTYVTTTFTALHFLDFDEQRDRDIAARFGSTVQSRLVTDRSMLIRRIFGTFPLHDMPKDQRVVNLFTLYGSWLSGGRALLLPVFFLGKLMQIVGKLIVWVFHSVQEIRKPKLRKGNRDAAKAHFNSAVRKIMRIRGPAVLASLRIRMMLDPEFLGVPLPGSTRTTIEGSQIDVDLSFLRLSPAFHQEVEQERERTDTDIRRLNRLLDTGLLDRAARSAGLAEGAFHTKEHLRAATIAYVADLDQIRVHLTPRRILNKVFQNAMNRPPSPSGLMPHLLLKRKFNRYWAEYGFGGRAEKKTAWRAVVNNVWQAKDALIVWADPTKDPQVEGERRLGRLLLHPRRVSEQIVTVRAIQSLAVLDVLNYREHIYKLGRYGDMGDYPGTLLTWSTSTSSRLSPTEATQ